MKILFQINHPAHYHLFKNTVQELKNSGHDILILFRQKDMLSELISNDGAINISAKYRKNNKLSILSDLLKRTKSVYKIANKWRPNIMAGTAIELTHSGFLLNIPTLFFGEDDASIVFWGSLINKPFTKHILSPASCNNLWWNKKTVFYSGFQKLAYLHPNRFFPDRSKVDLSEEKPFFFLRLASLQAYHDKNAKGISDQLAREIVKILASKGNVLVSSERQLPDDLERFSFTGNKNDIHHYLYYANLLVCDSQSMAVEAAMLGTPNIRYSNFVGKISVLEELEHTYQLTTGVKASDPDKLLRTIKQYTDDSTTVKTFKTRRQKLLDEKIDVTAFMVWFIENYPESAKIMREDPTYQERF